MKKSSRGLMSYVVLIGTFLLIAILLNGSLSDPVNKRIEYPELLQMIQEDQERNQLITEFGRGADLSPFADEETAREAFLLSLLSLAGAVMDGLEKPEQMDTYRHQLELRLRIIKQGSLADGTENRRSL